MFGTSILLLLCLLFVTSSSQQCNTSILRDIIKGSPGEENLLGEDIAVPILNQSEALRLRHIGSDTPIFQLDNSYYITAIDIQFGSVGVQCEENGLVRDMRTITIGNNDPINSQNDPIQIGYADNNIMHLMELLGNPNAGRIIRFKINTTNGRYLQYGITATFPPITTFPIFLCLRTEFYGCLSTTITNLIFLQYNLIQPTVYTDSMYTGVVSMGYMSGGEGLINDGSIGTSPITDSTQWLGWSNPDLDNPEILFLFSTNVTIRNISVFYWGETSSEISVEISSAAGVETVLSQISVEISSAAGVETVLSQITQNDGSVIRKIYLYAGFSTGLLKLNFVGASTVLVTEIEIIDAAGDNLFGASLDTSSFTDTTTSTTIGTTTTTTATKTATETATKTGMITTTNYNSQTISQISFTTELPTLAISKTLTTTESTTQTAGTFNTGTNKIIIALAICILISVTVNLMLGMGICVCCCYNKRKWIRTENISQKDLRDNVVIQQMQEYDYIDVQPASKPDYVEMQPVPKYDYVDMQPVPKYDYVDMQPEGKQKNQNLGSQEVKEHVNSTQDKNYYEVNYNIKS